MSGVEARPVDVALRDGSTVRVRAVRPEDVEGLRALLSGMSDRSRWLRFLSAAADVEQAARSAARPEGGVGLVATAGSPERIVAHATYIRETPERAEVAFEVADAWHGRGLATILLAHLAGEAERDGVATFVAYVHPTNHRMIGVFRDSGFPVEVRATIDELVVEMPASLADDARERFEDRARLAAVAAVAHVLRPASVAVASPDVLDNAVAYGYRGAKLEAGPVELAVLDGSPEQVLDSARAWGASGARALAVLASGFADAGPAGRERLAELLAVCRRTGMRLIGPNSVGVLNTDPELRLNATRARQPPPAGRVALASQSGALGMAAMAEAARRGLGISSFASTGDKADLSGNDFLQYWQQDAATEVILLYLESFGNPRRFARIARDVALQKPIVAIKSGRDATVDALFAHAGVIRTDTLADQLDVAALLACQPLPDSDRVAIVSNARGPALACADACTAAGLRVVSSVDLGAGAVSDDYANALDRFRADAVVAIVAPGFAAEPAEVAGVLQGAAGPLLGVFMGQGDPELAALGSGALPAYRSPEEAARALGRAAWYAGWRRRPPDPPPVLAGVDADAAAAILATTLARGDGWLHAPEVDALLGAYGIRTTVAAAREPEGSVVQRRAPDGVEMLAGVVADPDFGPVVTCGPGGPTAELFGDAAVGLAPLGRRSAAAMVRSLRAFPLLDGYRGRPVADVGAFEDVLVRLAALAAAHGEVAEIDCDPVLAGPGGAVVIGARVRVQPAAAARPFPALDR